LKIFFTAKTHPLLKQATPARRTPFRIKKTTMKAIIRRAFLRHFYLKKHCHD
jgi:hypothetical protein